MKKKKQKYPKRFKSKKEYLQWRKDYYDANREAYLQRMRAGYHRRKAEKNKQAALPVKTRRSESRSDASERKNHV